MEVESRGEEEYVGGGGRGEEMEVESRGEEECREKYYNSRQREKGLIQEEGLRRWKRNHWYH